MGRDSIRLSYQALQLLSAFLDARSAELTGADLIRRTALMSGTVYPILLRFEELGLLRSRWEDQEPQHLKRPRRRLYTLTAKGASVARKALARLSPPWVLKPALGS